MSIYTITLKRELLGGSGGGGDDDGGSEHEQGQRGQPSAPPATTSEANFSGGREVDRRVESNAARRRLTQGGETRAGRAHEQLREEARTVGGSGESGQGASQAVEQSHVNDADWLDCVCGSLTTTSRQDREGKSGARAGTTTASRLTGRRASPCLLTADLDLNATTLSRTTTTTTPARLNSRQGEQI